jgi:hypothetical protein
MRGLYERAHAISTEVRCGYGSHRKLFPGAEMWCSFSASDRAAGLGQPSDDCVFGDAFALYLHWEHKGNFRTALAAIELPEGWADVEKT